MITGFDSDARFTENLLNLRIPPRPSILETVMLETAKTDPDPRVLAHAISGDVALSAALIKTVNSPFYGLSRKCEGPREALMTLGVMNASLLLASIALKQAFPPGPHIERFWGCSERVARLSAWLSHQLHRRDGVSVEQVYSFGLFRDCGIPILMQRYPGYKDILEQANQTHTRPFTQIEESHIPGNHAYVGSILAQTWWLPETLSMAIRYHHSFNDLTLHSKLSDQTLCLIATAQLAEKLHQDATGLCHTLEWSKLGGACLEVLGIEAEEITELGQLANQSAI